MDAERFSQLPPNSSLTIVDRNGIILIRLPNSEREGHELTNYRNLVAAPEPEYSARLPRRMRTALRAFWGFAPLNSPPRGVAIAVGFPQEAVLAAVRHAAIPNYLLLGMVTLLAVSAAVLVGRAFIRRPMNQLLDTVETWRKQDLSARVKHGSGRSEFDQLEQAFNSMADELEAALRHKDVLLRELSHRVMNSLQTISALFRMEAKTFEEPSAVARFEQAIRRLDAIALVYRRMQTTDGVEAIEFSGFLTEICSNLGLSMGASCVVEADAVLLPPKQAVSLALIVNELVTNAIKYGKNRSDPAVVEFRAASGQHYLSVRNTGSMPPNVKENAKGFGMKMIASMVSQLHGELEIRSVDGMTEIAVACPSAVSTPATAGTADTAAAADRDSHPADA